MDQIKFDWLHKPMTENGLSILLIRAFFSYKLDSKLDLQDNTKALSMLTNRF